jgi:hypothetical protein
MALSALSTGAGNAGTRVAPGWHGVGVPAFTEALAKIARREHLPTAT